MSLTAQVNQEDGGGQDGGPEGAGPEGDRLLDLQTGRAASAGRKWRWGWPTR